MISHLLPPTALLGSVPKTGDILSIAYLWDEVQEIAFGLMEVMVLIQKKDAIFLRY
jgi:hypothetical protein